MSLKAGRLNKYIQLQSPVHTQDASGDMTTTWTDVRKVWAAIDPVSAREFRQSAATQSQERGNITVRARSDIVPTWRATYKNKIYIFEGVLPDKESGNEHYTIPYSVGVGTGE